LSISRMCSGRLSVDDLFMWAPIYSLLVVTNRTITAAINVRSRA
jgi:hypothetical protein